MKTSFILSWTMLSWRGTEEREVILHHDVEEWCRENLCGYSFENVLVEAFRSGNAIKHERRNILTVLDEDDALLFKLRWLGRTGLNDNFLGPLTKEECRAPFEAYARLRRRGYD